MLVEKRRTQRIPTVLPPGQVEHCVALRRTRISEPPPPTGEALGFAASKPRLIVNIALLALVLLARGKKLIRESMRWSCDHRSHQIPSVGDGNP